MVTVPSFVSSERSAIPPARRSTLVSRAPHGTLEPASLMLWELREESRGVVAGQRRCRCRRAPISKPSERHKSKGRLVRADDEACNHAGVLCADLDERPRVRREHLLQRCDGLGRRESADGVALTE